MAHPIAFGLYADLGGQPGCKRLATALYARIARDPVLRPMFPGKTFRCAIDEFTAFLVQFLGGPAEETQKRWWLSLRESHRRFRIGETERTAWLGNMSLAIDDVQLQEPLRTTLVRFFRLSSAYLVNHGEPTTRTDSGHGHDHPELAARWEAQRLLDEATAAITSGDLPAAIALMASTPLKSAALSVHAGLLVWMMQCDAAGCADYVRVRLKHDPDLLLVRYAGKTLLHGAAAAGDPPLVDFLLKAGADANVPDDGGHPPLYVAANEARGHAGAEVVRTLIRAGANVTAHSGVQRTTALHMAARRGSVQIAQALIEAGAAINARDTTGATPLRRAVNCKQHAVAALLLASGEDIKTIF